MEILTQIIIEVLAVAIAFILAYLGDAVRKYISMKIDTIAEQDTRDTVRALVAAAEQQYKAFDKAGGAKKDYVVESLKQLGYEMGDYLNALIESEVYRLKE